MNSPKQVENKSTQSALAVGLPAATSTTRKRKSDSSRTEIKNLPDNVVLTIEILKMNVCRVCASYHESRSKLLPLYGNYRGIILSRAVNCLMLTRVYKNDGLPEVACRKCADQIVTWYEMRMNSTRITRILEIETQTLKAEVVNSQNKSAVHHFLRMMEQSSEDEGLDER